MHENFAQFLTCLDKNLRETPGLRSPLLECNFVLEEFAKEEAVVDSLHQCGGGVGSAVGTDVSMTVH